MLGFLKRVCFDFTDTVALKSIYCALVRSHLEFACVVWNPHYSVHISRIESIKKKLYPLRTSSTSSS